MSIWMQLLLLFGMVAIGWWIIVTIRRNPGAFSRENLSKSFFTTGILALILIGIVAMCVVLLRTHSV